MEYFSQTQSYWNYGALRITQNYDDVILNKSLVTYQGIDIDLSFINTNFNKKYLIQKVIIDQGVGVISHVILVILKKIRDAGVIECWVYNPSYSIQEYSLGTSQSLIENSINDYIFTKKLSILFIKTPVRFAKYAPQTIVLDRFGYCQTLSLIYIEYILLHPDLSINNIEVVYNFDTINDFQINMANYISSVVRFMVDFIHLRVSLTFPDNDQAIRSIMSFITDSIASINTMSIRDKISFISVLDSYIPI